MEEMKLEENTCDMCGFVCAEKGPFFGHLETHDGSQLSCRLCCETFENSLSFLFHKQANMCESYYRNLKQQSSCDKCSDKEKKCAKCKKVKIKKLKRCLQCNETFPFQRHYVKHLEGHKRNNCRHCCALFTTRKDLSVHLAEKHQIKIHGVSYPCRFCNRTFAKRCNLYYHYNQHAAGQFVCLTCGEFLKTVELLKDHEKKHNESKKWSCERCSESFFRRQQYLHHLSAHEKYKCKECGKSFAAKKKLWKHKQTVHDTQHIERRYQCSECGQLFSRSKPLKLHLRIHTGEKPYECKICGKGYHTERDFTLHKAIHSEHHVTLGVLKCDDCEWEFQRKHDLYRHIISVHRQELMFKCEHCDQKFNCKENLKRHHALHTEKPQFVCEHCGAALHSLTALKDHISYVHSQTREFICTQCGMSFKRNSGLNRHMISHSESRPFVCDCGQSYKRSSHLRRHKERTHGEICKNKKLVRLSENQNGVLVSVQEEYSKTRETKKKKTKQQKSGAGKMKLEPQEQQMSQQTCFSSLLPPTPSTPSLPCSSPPAPPPPAPPSLPPSPPTLPPSPMLLIPKVEFDLTSAILPLVDASEVDKLQEICGTDGIIVGNIDLANSDELTTIIQSENNSGNVLHTIVSYSLNDFAASGSLSSITGGESQLVFSGLPTSVALDQAQTVLTVTLDPLLESESTLKTEETFLQEKVGEGVGSLLLDANVSPQLALDSIADPLYLSNVSSTLITSADTTLSNTNALMSSSDSTLGGTLIPSADSSVLETSATLLSSVDPTLVSDLQQSEVLLNFPSHIDSQKLPYSLASSLNISVADCESLLAAHGSNTQTSPSMIHGSTESIGLDSNNPITISDYLNFNF